MSAKKKEYQVTFTTSNKMADILKVFETLSETAAVTNISVDEVVKTKPVEEAE